jgi:hypothetical protein
MAMIRMKGLPDQKARDLGMPTMSTRTMRMMVARRTSSSLLVDERLGW